MDDNRLNLPNTNAVILEVLGQKLQFSQDPNSKHLGTTVWDASMVFVKFLEKNCRKGQFCPLKLKGKRVIELGAGCGLAGFGMALLGCDVVSTDQVEVLPLLMRNVERNTSRITQANHESPHSASFGSIQVTELDWGNQEHIKAVDPPFDYIIGTDVVYAEHLLEPLLQTIFALSGPRTTVLLGYELRSTTVHEQMINLWKRNFEVKTIQRSKMDPKYQHSSIQLFIMRLRSQAGTESINRFLRQQSNGSGSAESEIGIDEDEDESGEESGNDGSKSIKQRNENIVLARDGRQLDEWEARRYGSLAARLLQNVRIA